MTKQEAIDFLLSKLQARTCWLLKDGAYWSCYEFKIPSKCGACQFNEKLEEAQKALSRRKKK